jgi:probable F420-dependent oxidoreductase
MFLPCMGFGVSREAILKIALTGERCGFDSCWAGDHIIWPVHYDSRYPYSKDGVGPFKGEVPFLDAVATLCFVAGATERVKLGTGVMVLGLRPPVQNAKVWTTLDVLSNGRAIMGVGVGWMKEEFDALSMPFDRRGARADEMLELFSALERESTPSYHGQFYRFEPVYYAPKPFHGHIPIWVGGHSEAGWRRAAKYAEVFFSVAKSTEELRDEKAQLARHCELIDRDPGTLGVALCSCGLTFDPELARSNPFAQTFGPSATEMVDRIGQYQDLGVEEIGFVAPWLAPFSIDGAAETYERFAAEVAPQL